MTELLWTPELELGVEVMDDDHRSFAHLAVACAEAAEDAETVHLFETLLEHSRAHFARENALMRETGFFAEHCHVGEHERVIALLEKTRAESTPAELRAFCAGAATEWFLQHLATMDRVTADWIQQRRHAA